jgi:hypothetical protein
MFLGRENYFSMGGTNCRPKRIPRYSSAYKVAEFCEFNLSDTELTARRQPRAPHRPATVIAYWPDDREPQEAEALATVTFLSCGSLQTVPQTGQVIETMSNDLDWLENIRAEFLARRNDNPSCSGAFSAVDTMPSTDCTRS